MRKTILLLLLSVMNVNVFSQTNTIKITFVGKQYNEMTLRLDKFKYKGSSIDKKTWEFSFPDSAFQQQSAMGLIVENSDSVYHVIFINAVKGTDTIGMGNFGLPIDFNDTLYFHSNFVKPKSPIVEGQQISIYDTFVLNKYFPEFDLWYAWLQSFDSKDFLTTQEQWIKSNPQSHYAMALFGKMILRYPTKDNVKTLYNLFEEEPKNSYYGLKVKAFLDAEYRKDYFDNRKLINSRTGESEVLINDFTKPTFIIFSASWCRPCHALAPKLKAIYKDIKNDVNFVYVTIDKKEDVKKWNAFMDEQNITWRSLASYQIAKDISQQFSVDYIPYSILVMPDRSIKPININNDSDKAELYKLSPKNQSK